MQSWFVKHLSLILLSIFCWCLPFAWIFAIPKDLALIGGKEVSIHRVHMMNQNINDFARNFKRAPQNLNEVRLFVKHKKRSFQAYDGFGHMIEYLPLDGSTYLIRSFGEDELEFRKGHPPDFVISNLLRESPRGISQPSSVNAISLYNPSLLLGALSPNGHWQARLYINRDTGARKLVIRDRKNLQSIMVSLHDRVEEFIWHPNSESVVFTASGSALYKDGVYLWDLSTGTTTNLIDEQFAKFDMHGLSAGKNFIVSIAGLDNRRNVLHVFIAVDSGQAMDPDQFYSQEALVSISLEKNAEEEFNITQSSFDSLSFRTLLRASYQKWQQDSEGDIAVQQRNLLNLRVAGDIGDILENWTSFTAKQKSNPILFPYLAMHLSFWYGVGATQAEAREQDILRAYGAELSKALATETTSPRYLAAMGAFVHKRMIQGQPLPKLLQDLGP